MIKKIAITGHSSGIGSAVMDLLDLTCNGTEIKGFSKSNGWNIADSDGMLSVPHCMCADVIRHASCSIVSDTSNNDSDVSMFVPFIM